MTPYPEERRIQNIIEQLRRTARECRERAGDYDALADKMERGERCERVEKLIINETMSGR